MNYNQLGHSDLKVSEIGFGCMSIGTEESSALRLIHEALDKGVNFLDTADLYDEGRNEELVGKAIQGRRSEVILATKVGNRRMAGQAGWVWDASKAHILTAVKDSLRRLGTDYIDLYQLHGGTMEDNIDETIEAFEELKQAGIIRYYGISSIRPRVIQTYAERSSIVSVMSQYSLLDRRPEEQVLPLLEQKGIGLIARGPLARGVIADHGAAKAEQGYLDYSGEELLRLRHQLAELVQQGKEGSAAGLTALALRFPLHHPAVATIIPGASSLEQLESNLREGTSAALSEEQYQRICQLTHSQRYEEQHRI